MVVKTVKRHNKLLRQRGSGSLFHIAKSALKKINPENKTSMLQQSSNKSISQKEIRTELLQMINNTKLDDFIKIIIDTSTKNYVGTDKNKVSSIQKLFSTLGKRNVAWYTNFNNKITQFYKKIEDNYDTIMPVEDNINYLRDLTDAVLVRILLALLYIKITKFSIDAIIKKNITEKLLTYYKTSF